MALALGLVTGCSHPSAERVPIERWCAQGGIEDADHDVFEATLRAQFQEFTEQNANLLHSSYRRLASLREAASNAEDTSSMRCHDDRVNASTPQTPDDTVTPLPTPSAELTPECSIDALRAAAERHESWEITLVRPQQSTGLLLIVGDREFSGVIPDPRLAGLLRSRISVGYVHATSAEALTADALIDATRELNARGFASPNTLFLEASGAVTALAAVAVRSHPEYFRGVILDEPLKQQIPAVKSSVESPWPRSTPLLIVVGSEGSHIDLLEWVRQGACAPLGAHAMLLDAPRLKHLQSGLDTNAVKDAFILSNLLAP